MRLPGGWSTWNSEMENVPEATPCVAGSGVTTCRGKTAALVDAMAARAVMNCLVYIILLLVIGRLKMCYRGRVVFSFCMVFLNWSAV